MVFVLFDKHKMYGLFKTVDLLKENCFIALFEKYEKKYVSKDTYFYLKERLLSGEELDIDILTQLMKTISLHIINQNYQEDGFYALQCILSHINDRFSELIEKMTYNSSIRVKFPGKNAEENKMITLRIEENWRMLDSDNFRKIIYGLKTFLTQRIQKLEIDFPERVIFGQVDSDQASPLDYQVWPADKGNWNLPEGFPIPGEEYAACFDSQKEGVFGIVIDPMFGYEFN